MTNDDRGEDQDIHFSLAVGEEEPRAGEWGSWEQSRTRSFFAAGPFTIGDGKLGSVANVNFDLSCKRTATGFEGSWKVSFEERIGPNRIYRDQSTGYILGASSSRIISFPMPQFAHACGTRRLEWSGALTREQFEQVTGFMIDGEVTIRRC